MNLNNSDAFSKTFPGKVQSYLAAGKPIIAALNGEGTNVILESQAGLVSNSGDHKRLAENIEKMSNYNDKELEYLSRLAKDYSDKNYSRENLINIFVEKLNSVLTRDNKEKN